MSKKNIIIVFAVIFAIALIVATAVFTCITHKSVVNIPEWVHPYNHCLIISTENGAEIREAKNICVEVLEGGGEHIVK